MKKLVFISQVKNPNDVLNFLKLLDQVESSVRNPKSLEIETNSYRQLLVSLLNEKLPNDLRLRIAWESQK